MYLLSRYPSITKTLLAASVSLLLLQACSQDAAPPAPVAEPAPAQESLVAEAAAPPAEASEQLDAPDSNGQQPMQSTFSTFWNHMLDSCGHAYAGALLRGDEREGPWLSEPITLHVRECGATAIIMSVNVGEDRSRTWVLSRSGDGLQFRHVLAERDGSVAELTGFGGQGEIASEGEALLFPADEFSKTRFIEHGMENAAESVWALQFDAEQYLVYSWSQPGREFAVSFSLEARVETPPAPWLTSPIM